MEGSMGTTESVQLAGINHRHLSAGLVARSRYLRGFLRPQREFLHSGLVWEHLWSDLPCLREDVSRIRRPSRLPEGVPAVCDPR
jgi:hypothetical protein